LEFKNWSLIGGLKLIVIFKTVKPNNGQKKKLLWVSVLILDVHLHKESKLGILGGLVKRGYAPTLIAMRSHLLVKPENPKLRILSIPLRYFPVISPIMFTIAMFLFLPIYILVSKPAYIITDPNVSIFSFASVLLLSKLRRIKLVLDIRSPPVEISGFRGFLQTFSFINSILIAKKFFDGITILTSSMKKEVCERFGLSPETVGIWSSGVSLTKFNPEIFNLEKANLRKKLGLSGKFVVLYHGVFSSNRGLIETIEAMSIVKKTNCNVIFLLLGTGPSKKKLKDLIQKRKLQENVIIHDPVELLEVPKYIAMCDVGIVPLPNHPYWRSQSPLKLLEYLAMKKVVLLTSITAHQLVVRNELCGIYISLANSVEIAKSILYAYDNREKLEDWGKCGRKLVEEEYTWEKLASTFERYLFSIDNNVSKT